MKPSDLVGIVEKLWNESIPDKRISVLQQFRLLLPEEHLELFDALIDAKISGVQEDPNSIVLLLVHGIQTDGAWQKLVSNELGDIKNLNVVELGYDCVTVAQLVSPFREAPVKKITNDIRDVRRREPEARLMVIAHSFGSYIVSQILKKSSDISFEKIIFCGSIVPRDYPWARYAPRMQQGSIINDVGTKDFYPIVATCSSLGYGSSGFRGFQNGLVLDRYFPYEHSTFFDKKRKHIKRFWRPFIESGKVRKSLWDVRKPKTELPLLMLSHPWIGRAVVVAVLLLLGALLFWLFS